LPRNLPDGGRGRGMSKIPDVSVNSPLPNAGFGYNRTTSIHALWKTKPFSESLSRLAIT
jgi:hypothetical protein